MILPIMKEYVLGLFQNFRVVAIRRKKKIPNATEKSRFWTFFRIVWGFRVLSLQDLTLCLFFFQEETVTGYLNSSVKLPDSKYFNSSNRAYPDVSAMSDDFWIIINRLVTLIGFVSYFISSKLFARHDSKLIKFKIGKTKILVDP